jgi:hypothetical protein
MRAIRPGDAAVRLMSALVNARNLPAHGFPETTRLARGLPAFVLSGESFEHAANAVADALRGAGR